MADEKGSSTTRAEETFRERLAVYVRDHPEGPAEEPCLEPDAVDDIQDLLNMIRVSCEHNDAGPLFLLIRKIAERRNPRRPPIPVCEGLKGKQHIYRLALEPCEKALIKSKELKESEDKWTGTHRLEKSFERTKEGAGEELDKLPDEEFLQGGAIYYRGSRRKVFENQLKARTVLKTLKLLNGEVILEDHEERFLKCSITKARRSGLKEVARRNVVELVERLEHIDPRFGTLSVEQVKTALANCKASKVTLLSKLVEATGALDKVSMDSLKEAAKAKG